MITQATLANPTLGELADDANAAHAACEQATRTALTHAYTSTEAAIK